MRTRFPLAKSPTGPAEGRPEEPSAWKKVSTTVGSNVIGAVVGTLTMVLGVNCYAYLVKLAIPNMGNYAFILVSAVVLAVGHLMEMFPSTLVGAVSWVVGRVLKVVAVLVPAYYFIPWLSE